MEQTQRTKLELPVNQPITLQLLFDNPLTGQNRYGDYFLYAFVDPSTGEEYSFFAPSPDVHEQLSHFNAGDNVTLLKSAKQNGRKILTEYSVTPANGGPLKSFLHDAPPVNGNGKAATPNKSSDAFFQILESCYADAIKLQERFNGMVDVNRLAITLFIARSKTNGHAFAGGVSS
ncbi:MAG: hypothetical protein RBU27_08005 [Bacteroidota bacterium]|jgi:hypothetical protein|nr:hypothetical protein [Bacteroidota bacterium]